MHDVVHVPEIRAPVGMPARLKQCLRWEWWIPPIPVTDQGGVFGETELLAPTQFSACHALDRFTEICKASADVSRALDDIGDNVAPVWYTNEAEIAQLGHHAVRTNGPV